MGYAAYRMQRDTDQTDNGRRDESPSGHATSQRYTVHEAALLLGLSVDAVRKRAERGSLKREKDPDGTVYIVLDTDESPSGHATSQQPDGDETATSQLVESLQDQVSYLRRELGIRNEELRRKDHLLAAALERIPAIEEAPPEPRESPETAPEGRGEGEVPSDQEKRSSWWRRLFPG